MPGVANFPNRVLYQGDNLAFLRGMNSESVHLIATDPPFNKGKDFHATPDSLADGASFQDRWRWVDDTRDATKRADVHPAWMKLISEQHPAVWGIIESSKHSAGYDMAAFLCWLGVRLLEMHRILRPDGSLYLHIDHKAHAYVKCLLDAIFGEKNFRNEIVWAYTGPGSPGMRQFNRKHDTLLWYGKSSTRWVFNKDIVRLPYKDGKPHTGGFTHQSGDKAGTRMGQNVADSYTSGKIPEDWWADIAVAVRSPIERTGYPTQKPLALYERIINASSNPGDIVLDPFCGCATTPVAAERLGRQWVGMDLWEGAYGLVVNRMNDSRQLLADIPPRVELIITPPPPVRTDNGDPAAPILSTPTGKGKGKGRRHPPAYTRKDDLLADLGAFCQGCGRDYSFDRRVLEVDHLNPKAAGGDDAYENLTLLCGPCNREKKDLLTLPGLHKLNREQGLMVDEGNIRAGKPGRKRRR